MDGRYMMMDIRAHLVYDEHDGAQDTQALASKTDFKIMVGCVDVQLVIDWQGRI